MHPPESAPAFLRRVWTSGAALRQTPPVDHAPQQPCDGSLVALALAVGRIEQIVNGLATRLNQLERSLLMGIGVETQKVLTAIDQATDRIAARIQALIDAADLSPEEKAAFQVEIGKLEALGSDPQNPVPPGT